LGGYVAPFLSAEDLSIFGIEITEGIQCFDTSKGLAGCANNSLPLVAQKNAAARIYLKYQGIGSSKAGIPVRLHLFANSVEYIVNTWGTARSTIRQDLNDNPNVWFNVDSVNGTTVLYYAEIDPDNIYAETDESNNRYPASGTLSVDFRKRRTFDVMGWRMRYHPSGFSGNQYAGGWAVDSGGADWLNTVWPVKEGGIHYSLHSGYLDWTSPIWAGDEGAVRNYAKVMVLIETVFPWLGIDPQLLGQERVHVWTPRDHFVRGISDPPGWGGGLGVASVGDDNPDGWDNMLNPGFGAHNFVHEVSHNTGMRHVGQPTDPCGSQDDGTDWPYSNQRIQEFGYDPDTGKVYNPSSSSDFMSYCYGAGSNAWISPFHWSQQFYKEGASESAASVSSVTAAGGDVLGVVATLDNPDVAGGDANGLQMYRTEGGGNIVPPPTGDGYSIELRNGGQVLASQPFGANFLDPEDPGAPLESVTVAFSMAWVDGTTSVVLLHGSQVLATVDVSANAPTVTVTDPATHEDWPAGTTQTVSWAGSDADGDPLTYSLFYSRDGATFQALATGLTGTSYDVEVDSIAGGDNAKFRVVASDGVNTGFGDSATISVPNKPPFVAITNPANNTLVAQGGLVVFGGGATDLEDGPLSGDNLVWSSDKDGALGTGGSLPLNTLSAGLHTITLRATDSDGAFAEASITVVVGMLANFDLQPDTISPAGAPPAVTAIVTLPPGYPTDLIDTTSLKLVIGAHEVQPTSVESLGDTDNDGLPELKLTFDGAAVQGSLPVGPSFTEASVTGLLKDGTHLGGSDTVGLILPGDVDCSGAVNSVDALQVLRHVAGLAEANCLAAAGNVNCGGGVDAVDALVILRFVAGLPNNLPDGCPAIGGGAQVSARPEFALGSPPDGGADGLGLDGLPRYAWLGAAFVVPALVTTRRVRRR